MDWLGPATVSYPAAGYPGHVPRDPGLESTTGSDPLGVEAQRVDDRPPASTARSMKAAYRPSVSLRWAGPSVVITASTGPAPIVVPAIQRLFQTREEPRGAILFHEEPPPAHRAPRRGRR